MIVVVRNWEWVSEYDYVYNFKRIDLINVYFCYLFFFLKIALYEAASEILKNDPEFISQIGEDVQDNQ